MKYNVERSITISTELGKVRPLIADFNHWNRWSPWMVVDPQAKNEITGQPGRVGSAMSWEGEVIGSGNMKLSQIESDIYTYALEFIKPFRSTATTQFILEAVNDQETKVTWTMDSSMPFFLFFMISTIKTLVGMDYERGLKMLKSMAEAGRVNATTINEGVQKVEGFNYFGIKKTSTIDQVPAGMSQAFMELMGHLQKEEVNAEKYFALYTEINLKKQRFTYLTGVSDEGFTDREIPTTYERGAIQSGKMLKIRHQGSYQFLGNAWSMGMMNLRAKKMKQAGHPFELYVNNPQEVPEEELVTELYFPVK